MGKSRKKETQRVHEKKGEIKKSPEEEMKVKMK